ncbi:hypothetical protein QLH32_05945 [Acinetobacter corruptisaponis]|uniref:Uncharacterized protein n=1 Tax=Acinetobacter corruptisaponis TaxID=3045147 RepID=A0ABY8S5M0_9GAMM|nr:hypothetical protein [Acinetobacter sp. KCTC 92772]WHP07003.1 hypothetical protein QLH32_05945 [Acinetobacter sp. KCTC 92772]
MQKDIEYYKNFKVTKEKSVEPAFIKKLREQKQQVAYSSFDMDVLTWLNEQDKDTKKHLNEVIRHFMAIKA